MHPVFKKLQFKEQDTILVLSAPDSFQSALQEMSPLTSVQTTISEGEKYPFVLSFAPMEAELIALVPQVLPLLEEDALLWFAYPKKSSKKYKSDINRDSEVWQVLGEAGFEGVRSVAIDEDWSALRFRNAALIKSMKRDPKRAMSKEGKKKTT